MAAGSSAEPEECLVVLVPALGVIFLVIVLVIVPAHVITGDLARGRPDIAYPPSEE
jgi:hypothetical protein